MANTKKYTVAINGFGRIGRAAFKIALERGTVDIVAINDLTDPATLAHLLKYDTVYGKYGRPVSASNEKPFKHKDCQGGLIVGNRTVPVFAQKEPGKLPWKKLGVDVVIESTGFFTSAEKAKPHLKAGAQRVIISAPAKDDQTPTMVVGVNAGEAGSAKIVSNASCTTNCIAPVAAVMHGKFGIEKAVMTTVHSYTADQNLVDGPHKDLRRARAAAANIVPTTTGAALATAKTIPELAGKFDGIALRVPTMCGSLSDITMVTSREVTVEEINSAFRAAAKSARWKGILSVTDEPLVSSDIIRDPHSAIVDLSFTQVVGGNLVKVLAWYDNEWGYASRLVDLAEQLAS